MSSNLQKRWLVAFWGVPSAIAAAYFGGWFLTAGVVLLCAFATREMERFLRSSNMPGIRWIIYLFAIALPILIHWKGTEFLFPLILFSILLSGIISLRYSVGDGFQKLVTTFFSITFIVLPYITLLLIRDSEVWANNVDGAVIIMYIVGGVWITDSFAYAIGKNFGKHKLAPKMSPNKTVEGGIGGIVSGIIWGYSAGFLLVDYLSIVDRLLIGLFIGLFAILGDMVESMIKRNVGVKDSGGAFPGHGGVYDRFDSLHFVAPVVYMYLFFLDKI